MNEKREKQIIIFLLTSPLNLQEPNLKHVSVYSLNPSSTYTNYIMD